MSSDNSSIIPIKNNLETPKNEINSSFIGVEKIQNNTKNENNNMTFMDLDYVVSDVENINIENEEELTTANEELETQVSESEPQYKTYTVSKYGSGEGFSTLWEISQDSGVSIDEIKAANPEIGADNVIHPGQNIIVPINNTIITEEVVPPVTNENKVQEEVINNDVEQSNIENDKIVSSVTVPSDINQTGIIPNYTNYEYFYGKWNSGTKQYELSEIWAENGKTNDRGIATIEDNYLVAVSPKFGTVGDKIGVVLEDGTTINCIIADTKGGDAGSEWGHSFGNSGIDIIEWESLGKQDTIELGEWKGKNVSEIINYGSYIEKV